MSIATVALVWSQIKMQIEHVVGFSSDSLHAQVGMLLFIALNRFLRGRSPMLLAWFFLLGLELANEALDMSRPAGSVESDLGSSLHDLINTMIVPTAMLLFWRPAAHASAENGATQPERGPELS
ncbi:hypothetical protein [Sphingobium aquiterrae]|uniref:hypothetical protein n=1 Tax=Sphingobium aquiterrae TaxID=2038656 RepID=UPI0030191330